MPHIAPAKKQNIIDQKTYQGVDTSVVILGANYVYRMKSIGPPSLFSLNKTSLINHQLDTINKVIKYTDNILVAGCEIDRILKVKPPTLRVIENISFDVTNEVEQIRLALNSVITNSVLIISGDVYFDVNVIRCIDLNHSCLLLNDQNNKSQVGVVLNKNNVSSFGYGLKPKWCHISYFKGREFELLKALCNDKSKKNMFFFEVINLILNRYTIPAINANGKFIKIESYDDLEGL